MGMTLDEFWHGEAKLAKYYREAYEVRRELENEAAWWQGVYIFEAIAAAMNGKKSPYPTQPHPINTKMSKERQEKQQEVNERKTVDYFMSWMERVNRKFADKPKDGEKKPGGEKKEPKQP